MILESPRIPLTKRTLVEEEQLLDQLDIVRINLPDAFNDALNIIRHKEDILLQAEEYAQDIIEAAQQRATEITNELGIIRQSEREANHIRQQVKQECEQLQQETLAEVDQLRRAAHEEIAQLRQLAIAEADDIQNGADEYANAMLSSIKKQLGDMMKIVRNGRQQLEHISQPRQNPKKKKDGGSRSTSAKG